MNTPTFETGATTAWANDLVLTVMNDGTIYRDRCHIGYATLQGASHRGMTFRGLCDDAARRMRERFGSRYRPAEITEAGRIVADQTIAHCLETIRDEYSGDAILCAVRRWFDSVNGNSYFSARIEIPTATGWHSIIVPFQYGYGSHWEHVCEDTVRRIGIVNPAMRYVDSPYGRKRDLYRGGIYIFPQVKRATMNTTTTRVIVNGDEYDIDVVRNLMDDDLCERIHGTVATEQEFVDAYCRLHAETFGTAFVVV